MNKSRIKNMIKKNELTKRQLNEIEYHKKQSRLYSGNYRIQKNGILLPTKRKWWNHYWHLYKKILNYDLENKKVLVVGCGHGQDAVLLSKLKANVFAFDLSPDMIKVAKLIAKKEGVNINYKVMACEDLEYTNEFFDFVFIRDILHHVGIKETMNQLKRVSKNGTIFFIDEVYASSLFQRIRKSCLCDSMIYPFAKRVIYSGKPYITKDEKPLDQKDVLFIKKELKEVYSTYFNFMINRIFPDTWVFFAKFERYLLNTILRPASYVLCNRIILVAKLKK